MNTSMARIQTDLKAFNRRIDVYIENNANPGLHKDSCEAAYEGLYKLIQRIKKELLSGDLNKLELSVCHSICDDRYLNGLLELRTVGTHIKSDTAKKKEYIRLYDPSGQPIEIDSDVSAGPVFAESIFRKGKSFSSKVTINHLQNLKTAKERIGKMLSTLSSN